jgi:hypothetical protein
MKNYILSKPLHYISFYYDAIKSIYQIYNTLELSNYKIIKTDLPELNKEKITWQIQDFKNKIKFDFIIYFDINEKDLITSLNFSYNFIVKKQKYFAIENMHPEHHGLKKGQAHCHKIGYKKPVKYNKDYISMSDFVLEALTYLKNR